MDAGSRALTATGAPQRRGDVGLIGGQGSLQRRCSLRIRGVGIGTGRQQHVHGSSLAVQCRQHQRRTAAGIARIDGRLLAQQGLQRLNITQFSGLPQLRSAVLRARRTQCAECARRAWPTLRGRRTERAGYAWLASRPGLPVTPLLGRFFRCGYHDILYRIGRRRLLASGSARPRGSRVRLYIFNR